MQGLLEGVDLAFQKRAGAGDRGEFCDAVSGCLGAVRGSEGVIDVNVAERGHAPGEGVGIGLLSHFETHVLAQRDAPGRAVNAVQPVAREAHRPLEQSGQHRRNRFQRQRGVGLTFVGPTEMRQHHHRGTGSEGPADRGQGCAQARVVGDCAILERHVEVLAQEHALPGQLEVVHAEHRARRQAFTIATVVSSMRLENPHSLSYQDNTLTRLPSMTLVCEASKIGRRRVVIEIDRHQWFVVVFEYALELAVGGSAQDL